LIARPHHQLHHQRRVRRGSTRRSRWALRRRDLRELAIEVVAAEKKSPSDASHSNTSPLSFKIETSNVRRRVINRDHLIAIAAEP